MEEYSKELKAIKEQVNNLIIETALNTACLKTLQEAFLDFICAEHPENKTVYKKNFYEFLNREQQNALNGIHNILFDTGDSGFFMRREFEAYSALQAILREVSKNDGECNSKSSQ